MSKYCFVIPCYQHSKTLQSVIEELQKFGQKIFVVNDGSDADNSLRIKNICDAYSNVELLVHPENRGKGAAFTTGVAQALDQGFTHGVQVDADGQHDLSRVEDLIKVSKLHPQDLISGQPVYDDSVPRSRLIGRYVTHVWVWIETLSFQIKDSMCGFRVYPLKSTLDVIRKYNVGKHMEFDTEVMVRMHWLGIDTYQIPVKVIYPENGISNFDVVKDNVRISKMHTLLVFGMIPRLPSILFRRRWRKFKATLPWHRIEEVGGILGVRLLALFYRLTGRKVLNAILYPVSFYYSLFNQTSKKASRSYFAILKSYAGDKVQNFSTFEHVLSFAQTAVDKFAVWFGDIKMEDLDRQDLQDLLNITKTQTGAFFISSHYGNIEVCRALGRQTVVKFNALVYYENARRFNDSLAKVNSDSTLNLISVKNVGPETAIFLKEKVDQGEWIFMMGDRLSIAETYQNQQKVLSLNLLGKNAPVSKGPFVMAYLLDVPVYVIHCFRKENKFRIRLKRIDTDLPRGKYHRDEYINQLAVRYTQELESVILDDPLQWYNFYQFWGA